jgi:chromate transport protein ChrA
MPAGGPVVIPLLRVYISTEWVGERDFLLGLAIIQAFPGPNFNFAAYLGALSLRGTGTNMVFGSLIGFIGIFSPGITVITGLMPLWTVIRNNRWIKSALRGVNAAAVGLVYSSVYRLFQVGLVDSSSKTGRPLGSDPWWVAITAGSFVAGRFFGFDAFLAIVSGGVLGLLWYAVTQL